MTTNIDYIIAAHSGLVAVKTVSKDLISDLGGLKRSHIPFLFYAGSEPNKELITLQEIGSYLGNKAELSFLLANTEVLHMAGNNHSTKYYSGYSANSSNKEAHFRARGFGDKLPVPYTVQGKHEIIVNRSIEVRSSEELYTLLNKIIPKVIKKRTASKTFLGRIKYHLKK